MLNTSHATAIVVGTIIGSGIFLVPQEMMRATGSSSLVYLAWIAGGLLSLFGAMTYAELSTLLPYAGGEYVYIRGVYGDTAGISLHVDVVRRGQACLDRQCDHGPGANAGDLSRAALARRHALTSRLRCCGRRSSLSSPRGSSQGSIISAFAGPAIFSSSSRGSKVY